MEFALKSSLRRRPLADSTNTISVARRNSLSSPAKSSAVVVVNSSKPKTKSKPLTSSSSLKSNTSTGSNNPSNVESLPSDSDPLAPPTPISDSVENQKLDPQERKDKGKKVLDSPSNDTSISLRLHDPLTLSSAASGNCRISNPPAAAIQKLNAPKDKDKRKMVQETLDIEASEPSRPRTSSPSAVSGTRAQERPVFLTVYNHRRAPQRKPTDGMTMARSGPLNKRTKNKGLELDDGCVKNYSGSHTDPLLLREKKQFGKKRDNDSAYTTIPQDNVDMLIAYYAEIDKFELIVEAASESD